jgi:Spy/CpxP family protein refolding chaperone
VSAVLFKKGVVMAGRMSVGVLLSLVVVVTAAAQRPSDPPLPPMKVVSLSKLGMGIDPVPVTPSVLIQKSAVQKELGLTDAQRKRVESLEKKRAEIQKRQSDEARARLRELGSDPALQVQARQELLQAFNEATRRLQAETDAAVLKALDPKMRTRLREIQYQVEGPLVFERPEVLEKLFLDELQLNMVRETVAEGHKQMKSDAAVLIRDTDAEGQARTPSEKETKTAVKKNTEATIRSRDTTTKAILKVLTKGQRARYEKLLGEPFDLAKLRVDGSVPSTRGD